MVEALEKGQINNGDKLVMVGFGGGLTWGALAAEWTGPLPSKGNVHPEQYRVFGRFVLTCGVPYALLKVCYITTNL